MENYNKSMDEIYRIGQQIKGKRLANNMRMDDLARKAGVSRATLWSIENGKYSYSIESLMKVTKALEMVVTIDSANPCFGDNESKKRKRASRINAALDKRINKFIIMCVQEYADHTNKSSRETYETLETKGIIAELVSDYEDMHGMSAIYINDYIDARLKVLESDETQIS